MNKKELVMDILSEIDDPELMIDLVSLGLIYDVTIKDDEDVEILMTLTFPGCPFGPSMVEEIKERVYETNQFRNVEVIMTFDPPWSADKIDPDIRAALNL
ncbi:MAG: metal-sulfur cluster assembly factor [Candidatus Woesearchaeota archaeon]